MIINIRTKISL